MQTHLPDIMRTWLFFCSLMIFSASVSADDLPIGGTIVPATPIAFEPVFLVLPQLDDPYGYYYVRESPRVQLGEDGLAVSVQVETASIGVPPAGEPRRHWVRLGQLPEGNYHVHLTWEGSREGAAEYDFTVNDPGLGDPHAPAFDYSGFYWNPLESGSAFQVIQTGKERLAAALLIYDDQGAQQWIMLGVGHWESPGRYVGQAWTTSNGHPLSEPPPDQRVDAESEVIGEAIIDFGGGLGVDTQHVSIRIISDGETLYRRDYQRFEF